ncbi:hypothetical protein [Nocardia sp. NBC_01009]|uniref:hypothetical protein n=1 Tax=Nocardia sp. NBC_01009 TaxID=2975996 RepID=UPI003868F223|nr:hypothetical protein OHA42_14500 [Nocardia sp. NBC_01009]
MRIIRPHDPDDDDDRQHGRTQEPAATPTDPAIAGELFADEVEEFLAALANPDRTAPVAATEPPISTDQSVRRAAPTVVPNTEDQPAEHVAAPPVPARPRARMLGRTAASSSVVVGLGVTAGWGEPLLVTGPLAVYGAGWLAYLWWNAALRPPIPLALGHVSHALSSAVAVPARALCRGTRSAIGRADAARTRHEAHRTTPATQQ